MKKIRYTFISLLALLLMATPLHAQDQRTLDTKVADLLVQVPADNEQELNEQMQALLQLEEAGLQKVMDQVIPAGTGDDTQARMAVESLSRFVSQPGKEKEAAHWESLILKNLEKQSDPYVKSFLMEQLYYMGSEASLESLKKYLTDSHLHDPAIRVLRDAVPDKAADAFAEALAGSSGDVSIALVNAIRECGNQKHAADIASLAGSGNAELQKSVLACLAALGNPDSYKVLSTSAKAAKYMVEPTNATGSLLDYAQTLSEQKNQELSLKICKLVDKKCKTAEQIHFKCKALTTAAGNYTITEAIPLLVKALQSNSKAYRMCAIQYATTNDSPVEPWYPVLENAQRAEVASEVLFLMGELNKQRSANLVTGYLTDPNPQVREQAIASIALIRKSQAVPHLVKHLMDYPSSPDAEAVKAALMQCTGKDLVPMLAKQLPDAPDNAKVVLLEVIAAKGQPSSFQTLYDQVKAEGEVRSTALANLPLVSSHEHLETLLKLSDQLQEEEELSHVENALVEAILSSPDKEASTGKLLAHADKNASTGKYIGVLASVGGKDALDAVYAQYKKGDEAAKKQALTGLLKSLDISAAPILYEICSDNPEEGVRNNAYRNYLRVVSGSALADDQKLLLLRKIEPLPTSKRNTTGLLRAMGGVKTYLSFITLSKYLDNEDLQSEAANALVRVVLPSGGQDNGLEGKLVRKKLEKAKEIISGPDSEYLQIDIENYMDGMPEAEGFVSMFNGKDLEGWQGLVGDPVKRSQMKPEELEKLQKEANEKVKENWSVKDQCIVFNGNGANLCSVKEYGDFEMLVDWRITKKGDSGLYLRGTPQVQIWDTSRVDAGAQVGSGGLYNNQTHESKPLVVADNPIGDWNTFRIKMIGERVTVYLNGQLVVDNVIMENYWDRSIPIFPKGAIELQAHGTDLAFRDIFVRELDAANTLSPEEEAEGFVSLFNGMDLTNWTGKNHSYKVEDGTIVIRPTQGGGNLYTEKEYADFIFRFEFKLTPGANNGLGIRAPLGGDAAYQGYELQILDNDAPVYAQLKPYQYHGSVYGIIPAKRGFQKPVGEWNKQEVWIKGDDIKITLNDTVILEGNIKEAAKDGTPDGREHPGLKRTTGHIGFLGHGSELWFRNIRIKEL
jgi:HEAT repeat protein